MGHKLLSGLIIIATSGSDEHPSAWPARRPGASGKKKARSSSLSGAKLPVQIGLESELRPKVETPEGKRSTGQPQGCRILRRCRLGWRRRRPAKGWSAATKP